MGLALLYYPTKDNVLPDIDVGNFGNAGVATSLTIAIFNNYPIIYLAISR